MNCQTLKTTDGNDVTQDPLEREGKVAVEKIGRAAISDTRRQGIIMKRAEAERLRKQWGELRLPPCTHKSLSLEESPDSYLTARYVCNRCGEVVFTKPK
jgi:hypothetical protein